MDEAFVAARPRLKVGPEERTDVADALQSLVVNQPLHGMAHAEVQLGYVGQAEGSGEPDYRFGDVALGDRVQIAFGSDREIRVIDGEITAIEERYGNGAPRLVWLVQDKLHRLARSRHSRTFADTALDETIRSVASGAGLDADVQVSSATATWHQLNESDLAFLLRLVAPFAVALRLAGGGLRARPEEPDPAPVALDAGGNALSLRLIADLNHQPTDTGVRGFNPGSAEAASGSVSATREGGDGSPAAELLGTLGWAGNEQVPQPFAPSQALADAYARGHFERQARAFLSGEIACTGDPRLASGREIELSGVSERMAGKYRVVHCVHRFDATGGYRTQLRVARARWGGR